MAIWTPETARFDAEAMLAAARSRGFTPSKRLLSDWVSLGLLDRPLRKGLGRGRGSTATWPAEQRELFLQLLAKRATVRQIAPLCNIPVWLWLYYGYCVSPQLPVNINLQPELSFATPRCLDSFTAITSEHQLQQCL